MSEEKKVNFRDVLLIINSVLLLLVMFVVGYMYIRIFKPFEKEPDLSESLRIVANANDLLKGAQFTGNPNAKVSVILFNSFSCGWCANFKPIVLQVLKDFPNDVKLVYKHYNRSKDDIISGMAVECAGDQNKFWQMYEALFEETNQGNINLAAKSIGLDLILFKKCVTSNKYKQKSITDTDEGSQAGVTGTPAFIVNTRMYEGFRPYEILEKIIQKELKEAK